ncbi:hypothetical protein [Vibrio tetraodonis]|uniref:hypothetical protein n=1 Tax=Vibrio tetraodonis TaxID=2231647 RepID=UPI000E0CAA1D|nr:hypothetical protein [Vibrio tetraodonis]
MNTPKASEKLEHIAELLKKHKPFTFIRFSDGEIEILRNRYLEINNGKTVFRGRIFDNVFPDFDKKLFDPKIHTHIRKDLLESAMYRAENFIKGIPTSHNNALIDREFMLRLNGGYTEEMSFSDLFLNSNYLKYRDTVVPLFSNYSSIYVVANYRSRLTGCLSDAELIDIPDNFFNSYRAVKESLISRLEMIEEGSLVLSSASSLSNVVGLELSKIRQDITFLDVGTSINDLFSLDNNTRQYHSMNGNLASKTKNIFSKGHKIKW